MVKKVVKFIGVPFVFIFGYFGYLITGRLSKFGYKGFKAFFAQTGGGVNDFFTSLIRLFKKPYKSINYRDDLNKLTDNSLDEVVSKIDKDGYYIFDKRLADEEVNNLVDFSKQTKAKYLIPGKSTIVHSNEKVDVDLETKDTPKYQYMADDLINNEVVQSIVFNKAFLAISNKYFKSKPIFDTIHMWWSFAYNNKETSNLAQMFHFDLPRFKWIKFFIYLTDVDSENGPHTFVKGSHKRLPRELRRVERFTDEEVKRIYTEKNVLEFTGKKGTVIAVDTRGLHKGKPLQKDKRLMLQIRYANSLYGKNPVHISGVEKKYLNKIKNQGLEKTYKLLS